MKKIIFLAFLMMCAVTLTSQAQTYCFKTIENVTNGVKSKVKGGYTYFTFQDGMSRVYLSDANGYAAQNPPLVYKLVSTANGLNKYQQQGPYGLLGNYYTFNSDFTRANSSSDYMKGFIGVMVRVDGPEETTEEFY